MTNEIKGWKERTEEGWKPEIIEGLGDAFYRSSRAHNFMYDEIAELRAKVESLVADAGRYQWLRHGDNDELVIQHGPVAPDYHWLPRNERLDEMIDAHRAKEKA